MRDHRRPTSAAARLLLIAVAWLIGAAARAEGPPSPVLHLADGGFVPGELKDSDRGGILRWQAAGFVAPFDFALKGVNAVHWPLPAELPKARGDYAFELSGGDFLFGSLVALDGEGAELDVPRIGRLRIPRSRIHRMDRWRDGADVIYVGPNGLAGWQETSREKEKEKGWREEAGQLVTEKAGASLRGDLDLPARAVVEFEISWKGKPDFVLALGVDERPETFQQAFRFEVWDGDMVALRMAEREADVALVGPGASGPGRAHLFAYLDQERGRLLVASPDGKPLADLQVAGRDSRVRPGVQLANNSGDVRLERLRISRWDGEPPRQATAGKSRIHRVDGSIVYGQVTGYDAAAKEFVVREESGETRVAEDRVARVFLPPPDDDRRRSVRVVYQDGVQLGGELKKVEDGALWLALPGVAEPLRLPASGLRSLVVLHSYVTPPADDAQKGRLEMEGVRLQGHLVDGRERPGSSCLAWQPLGSATASPLRPGVSGRIVYREPRPPSPRPATAIATPPPPPPPPAPVAFLRAIVRGPAPNPPQPQPRPSEARRALHLRTGDVIPSEVTKIDEAGVWIKTPLTDGTFVPHDKVQAVELAPEAAIVVRLNKSKRERLLTLPRMQKESPPTHMIRSRNGDFLRGRVLGMDDRTLRVEVRLETKDVPRDRVARIIWLHPEAPDPSKEEAAKPDEGAGATRVQALRSDGTRLTFLAERSEGEALSGKSDVLGACRVRIAEVDQLLIGDAIERAAAQLAYQQWKLHDAPEPKAAQGDGGQSPTGGTPGTESALVGKPAPEFELELLGGKRFRLAESKGKVVVLDFWATWCGPCLQAMPQVDRVTQEFRDRGVQLVAVNLQETPDQVSAMLERHKLRLTVALDRDGVVAEKYGATAIPQTVIIDGGGTIARLFVGGGPHLGDQLRDALNALLPGSKPKE
jgi:peroxiredoxin